MTHQDHFLSSLPVTFVDQAYTCGGLAGCLATKMDDPCLVRVARDQRSGRLARRYVVPSRLPVPNSAVYVPLRSVPEKGMIPLPQFANHAAGYTRVEHLAGYDRAWQYHSAGRDQRPRTDPSSAEHDGANPDQRALTHHRTVHGRVVAEADQGLEHHRFAGIDVDAAQILDVAFRADR